MSDSDVFGVQNPETGEMGYCCVMGALGQHLALGVYLGADGLEGYLKIRGEEVTETDPEMLFVNKCLMASFEDKNFLEESEREIIKKLGLKFEGKNGWPLFRNWWTGYFPRNLIPEEIRYLTLCFQQAKGVCLRVRETPWMLFTPEKNHYFARLVKREKKGLKWRDGWIKPIFAAKEKEPPVLIDEDRVARIKETVSLSREIWEVDSFYSPIPVREKDERPHYPMTTLWVDHRSGFIWTFLLSSSDDYRAEMLAHTLKLFEEKKFVPAEIWIKKDETFELFKPISEKLGIKLRKREKLPSLELARIHMHKTLG